MPLLPRAERGIAMKPRAGDFIIAAFVALLAAAIWLVPLLSGQGSVAIVSHDGKTVANIPLSETHRIEVGGCVIRSDGGSIYVESADCPDSVCVRTGRISRPGESVICVPNRVSIKISGVSGFDAVAG